MPEQNLKTVAAAFDPFRVTSLRAAQIGLVGSDEGDEGKYRRISSRSVKDLTPMQYHDVCLKAFYLWQRNPLAKRLIEIPVDFCTGEDLQVKARIMKRSKDVDDVDTKRKDAQQSWNDFWEDPINHLEPDFPSIVIDYLINGELAMPAFVNETDGKVRLGYYIPSEIKEVIAVKGNAREIDVINLVSYDGAASKQVSMKVIRYNVDGNPNTNEDFWKLVGEGFFFQTNKIPSQLRGYSIIMDLIDWLDAFDQFAFGVLDGFEARNDYFFDCELKGYNDAQIKNVKIQRPQRGEVNVHNENATWDVVTPDLKAHDASVGLTAFRGLIVGSQGYPGHWFGDDSGTHNRGTAEAMAEPTRRMLKRIQSSVKQVLKFMAMYVLEQAVKADRIKLGPDEYFDVDISTFDIDGKDIDNAGAGFAQVVSALALAATRNWIKDDDAAKVVRSIMGAMGIEMEVGESVEDIKNKKQAAEDESALQTPTKLNNIMPANKPVIPQ